MERIAVLCSGGDAPGMNAALRAIVRTCVFNGIRIYGVQNGYRGLIEDKISEMSVKSVSDIIHRGGTILGSARSEKFMTEEGQQKALQNLLKYKIDGLIVLGGDGSFKGAHVLSKEGLKVVGIPCTIDNDLGYTKFTIGFYTAVETVLEAIGRLRDTSSSHGIGVVVEVMGRNCGDIALYAGIAGGAEAVLVPEFTLDVEELIAKIQKGKDRGKKHQIIIMAEGVDQTEHLCEILLERTGIDWRTVILGHTQRGGTPSAFDRIIASQMGSIAVEKLIQGEEDIAIGTDGNDFFSMAIDEAVTIPHTFDEEMYRITRELSI